MTLPPLALLGNGSFSAGGAQSSAILEPLNNKPAVATFRPVATKAERYEKLVEIDRRRLQRPEAHFRNALKTTKGLERAARRLEKVCARSTEVVCEVHFLCSLPQRLEKLEGGGGGGGISFERLSAVRDAFEEVVDLSQAYCPQLKQIKVNLYRAFSAHGNVRYFWRTK